MRSNLLTSNGSDVTFQSDGNTIRLAHLRVAKLQPKKAAANLSTKVAPSQSSDDLNDLGRSVMSLEAEPVPSAGSCWRRNIDPQGKRLHTSGPPVSV